MEALPKFDDLSIQLMFGHEAAEDEDPNRLRDYYFKGDIFQRATADLPLRILVGHKGIGKSALIQVAKHEDADASILAILLRPDDVHEIATNPGDLLGSIRNWKAGLLRLIFERCVATLGLHGDSAKEMEIGVGARLLDSLATAFKPVVERFADADAARVKLAQAYLKNRRVRVYLDDLDRAWTASKESIVRLSALLNAMRDLSKEHAGLQFRVSLRSDVYYLVRTSDESTDKIEGSVVWHTWSNHEILSMLVKRVQAYFGNEVDEERLASMAQHQLAALLGRVLEPRFFGHGSWANIPTHRMLMSLIRRRPRDLVKLCSSAGRVCHERRGALIGTSDFSAIFDEYSQGRLQDTINEFRSELPHVEALLLNMRPTKRQMEADRPYIYNTAELLTKMDNIKSNQRFTFFGGRDATNKDLAAFLYKINFLTARKMQGGQIERQYFEENRYLSSQFTDFGYEWEVHPAYRWALQPSGHRDVLRLLDDIN